MNLTILPNHGTGNYSAPDFLIPLYSPRSSVIKSKTLFSHSADNVAAAVKFFELSNSTEQVKQQDTLFSTDFTVE
jgi:hypothetical protein